VTVSVSVNVARTKDEAERQEKGEDVIAAQAAEEAADLKEANAERAAVAVGAEEAPAADKSEEE